LSDKLGIQDKSNGANSPSEVDFSGLKLLRIVQAGSGHQSAIENVSMSIGGTLNIKAALYDLSGNYLTDAPANFTLTNSIFSINDLVVSGDQFSAAFNPSEAGSVIINATYAGSQANVISPNDSTGIISVANNQVPSSLQVISGNNQSAIVNTNLNDPLIVQVLDEASNPIAGVSVNFEVILGSGTIQGTSTVTTDSQGYASVTAKVGSEIGTNAYKFKAKIVTNNLINTEFNASAVAQFLSFKVLKIVASGVGSQAGIENVSLLMTDSVSMKAALFDLSGNYLEDAPALFTFSNSNFSNSNLVTSNNNINLTFTPSASGTVIINAVYAGSDGFVIGATDSTGLITVTNTQVPTSINLISGNNQTGGIGTNLTDPLRVRVLDQDSQPIAGVTVDFTVTFGTGAIQGNSSVATDSQGYASVVAKLGTQTGSNTHKYKASVNLNTLLNVEFQATAVAQYFNYKVLKIIGSGSGNQSAIDNVSMLVGEGLSFKAALFDLSGNYLEDAPAIYTLSNATFPAGNLSTLGDTGNFEPTLPGTVVINAAYSGNDGTVITQSDSTGLITVTNIQIPNSILLIAGNNQSGTVNNNLQNQLQVKVLDEFSQPIQGVSITFQVTQGSGAIIGTNPVFTNALGIGSATVKLGTVMGGNNNQYRAVITSQPMLMTNFQASATPGPQHHLTFTTQPNLLFAQIAFGVQPVVELRDEFNNLISASGTITMSKSSGTTAGILGGTLTAAMTNGVATFSNLTYSLADSAVYLQASNGTVTGLSSALTIGAAPPGACAVNDAFFITSDGGCKDNGTGLVWSQPGTSTILWYNLIWDNLLPGAASMDADDFGRGNDYVENITAEDCDAACDQSSNASSSTISYCKSLNEGGKTDWRVPNKNELSQLYSNGAAGHLSGTLSRWYWSSSSDTTTKTNAYGVRLSDGLLSNIYKYNGYVTVLGQYPGVYPICVRGGTRNNADSLSVLSGPTIMGINQIAHANFPLQVIVKDSTGARMNASGRTVTLSSPSLGSLGGTLTAITDKNGMASFTSFTLSQAGNISFTISSSGLTSTTYLINVINETVGSQCLIESSYFQTTQGGCKDMTTDLVWSSLGLNNMTWYNAIWDSSYSGAPIVDSGDYGRSNDYVENTPAEDCSAYCDNATNTAQVASLNTTGYCKSLNEGGKTDWRVPSKSELLALSSNGAVTHLAGTVSRWYWSSSSDITTKSNAYGVRLSDGLLSNVYKNNGYVTVLGQYPGVYPICVRGGKTNLSKLSNASTATVMGFDGTTNNPIQIQVQDSLNNNGMAAGITITVSSSSGTLSGGTTAVTNYQGIATFSPFAITGATGTITLTFSSPGLTSSTMNVVLRTGVGPHACAAESSRFKSQYGGCHDSDTDLAWSSSSSTNMTWHQAVWDSTFSGSSATDFNDYGRLNDYDTATAFAPGTGPDTSASAYCKSLLEAGYSDWRLPTKDEWEYVRIGSMARTYFSSSIISQVSGNGIGCYWTSSTLSTDKTQAYYAGTQGAGTTALTLTKSSSTMSNGANCDGQSSVKNIRVVCVRDNSP
jgi:hypothetical protein